MDAGVNILCYKSKTLANGAHPLMIRVCKDGKEIRQSRRVCFTTILGLYEEPAEEELSQ